MIPTITGITVNIKKQEFRLVLCESERKLLHKALKKIPSYRLTRYSNKSENHITIHFKPFPDLKKFLLELNTNHYVNMSSQLKNEKYELKKGDFNVYTVKFFTSMH